MLGGGPPVHKPVAPNPLIKHKPVQINAFHKGVGTANFSSLTPNHPETALRATSKTTNLSLLKFAQLRSTLRATDSTKTLDRYSQRICFTSTPDFLLEDLMRDKKDYRYLRSMNPFEVGKKFTSKEHAILQLLGANKISLDAKTGRIIINEL